MSLMNKDAKKNIAALIIRRREDSDGQPKETHQSPPEELDNQMGLMSASEEILRAVDSRDPKMLLSSIKSLIQMVNNESEPESEEMYES